MKKLITILFWFCSLVVFSQSTYSIWYVRGSDTTLVKNGTDSAFTTSYVFIKKVKTGDRPGNELMTSTSTINPVQSLLVSGSNIKTINNSSIIGSGNLVVSGDGASWGAITGTLANQTDLQNALNLKAPLASPTFTGTVSGITATMVGLGNVTNESKATMFTNTTFTGTFDVANGSIANADLANAAVANLSGTNTGDQDLSSKQNIDADLTTIAGLTATTNNFLVSVSSAWASRTPTQVKATLAIANTDVSGLGTLSTQSGTFSGTSSGTNTGDQTSIVGITGTVAQFNTAITDGDLATGGGTATGTNTGDNATNSQYSGLVTNATHTGDATGATALTVVKIQGKDFPTLSASDDQKYPKYVSASNAFVMTTLAGGGDALVANPLSQFASTTSAQLGTTLSDEVGTLGGFKREASIKLGGDYTNSTVTGTEITGLQISSTGTGLLYFEYWLLVQSAATTTGWKFGINHTGTATVLALNMTYPSSGTTAANGVGENVVLNNTGSIYEASANTAVSSTAPNLGPTAGVAATGTNVLVRVFGLLNVTVSGDLEIWAGSEIAASQISVMTNSFGTASVR